MIQLATLVALSLLVSPQDAVYKNEKMGFEFTYPATWKRSETATGTNLSIPISEGKSATLELFDIDFRAAVEVWQNVEKASADQHRRTVERQWQEEVLGVPMLLTKANINGEQGNQTFFSGLLYTASPRKLRFILISPTDVADQAELAWRKCLESLRTVDGKLPASESPDRAPEIIPTVKPPTLMKPRNTKNGEPVRGSQVIPIEVGELKTSVYLPEGWTLKVKDSSLILENPKIQGSLTFQSWKVGDDSAPGKMLGQASGKSLDTFKSVLLREDKGPLVAGSGATVAWVKRTGTTDSGSRVTLEFVGLNKDLAWMATYSLDDAKSYEKVAPVLNDLIQKLFVEVQP
ncbi:MAG TPA: hypothetical protein PKA27_11040 [Fimbriimonadaceae bacterium]|nr:hypothetical protein [Fimbriimonadaceae bacterium]